MIRYYKSRDLGGGVVNSGLSPIGSCNGDKGGDMGGDLTGVFSGVLTGVFSGVFIDIASSMDACRLAKIGERCNSWTTPAQPAR